ncbi:MAG: lipid-binding SYLF domain-containing protein [Acidobacteria bacterium]|nr:lipid-binding SYLF domain-containing protein [Acidobacteriota bacterium]
MILLAFVAACARNKTATTASGQVVTGDKAAVIDRLRDAGADLQQLMGAPDSSIPDTVLKDAKCVAVVPDMVKGGFVVGAQHGRGVATCRTGNGWSAPAFFTLTGGTWGAQIGVESVDLVMLVMNQKGMQDLLNSEFKLGGDAGVAAGPVGREAQASTNLTFKSEVLSYSRARGLFAGLDLNGAVIKPDQSSTAAFYGSDVPFRTLLTGGERVSADARPFVASVQQAFHEANVPANP